MATRKTHSFTARIKQLKIKKTQRSLTDEEIAELAKLMLQYGEE